MRIVKLFVAIGGIALVTSCASHAPCPGLGGENVEKEKMEIPVHSAEIEENFETQS